jgi:hypothetical protein
MAKLHKDGWSRNLETIRRQWGDYTAELKRVVFPDIVAAAKSLDVLDVLHKIHAIVEEAFDKMPRIFSYLFWVGLIYWLV